jgi:hypothetical protein
MIFVADKNLYRFECSGRIFHARHGIIGMEPGLGQLWEGGQRIVPMSTDYSPAEQAEMLEEVITHWLTWAKVANPRTLAQLTVAFAMHVEKGGTLPAPPTVPA